MLRAHWIMPSHVSYSLFSSLFFISWHLKDNKNPYMNVPKISTNWINVYPPELL